MRSLSAHRGCDVFHRIIYGKTVLLLPLVDPQHQHGKRLQRKQFLVPLAELRHHELIRRADGSDDILRSTVEERHWTQPVELELEGFLILAHRNRFQREETLSQYTCVSELRVILLAQSSVFEPPKTSTFHSSMVLCGQNIDSAAQFLRGSVIRQTSRYLLGRHRRYPPPSILNKEGD